MRVCVFTLLVGIAGLAPACSSDSLTMMEFGRELDRAKACSAGDSCVLFDPNRQCLCVQAVNANELDRIRGLSGKVDCDGAMASCPAPPEHPQCVDGVCGGKPASTTFPTDAATE